MKIHFTENYDVHKSASIYVFKNKPSFFRCIFKSVLNFVYFSDKIKPSVNIKGGIKMKNKPRKILVTCFKKTEVTAMYVFTETEKLTMAIERKKLIEKGYGAGDIYMRIVG